MREDLVCGVISPVVSFFMFLSDPTPAAIVGFYVL